MDNFLNTEFLDTDDSCSCCGDVGCSCCQDSNPTDAHPHGELMEIEQQKRRDTVEWEDANNKSPQGPINPHLATEAFSLGMASELQQRAPSTGLPNRTCENCKKDVNIGEMYDTPSFTVGLTDYVRENLAQNTGMTLPSEKGPGLCKSCHEKLDSLAGPQVCPWCSKHVPQGTQVSHIMGNPKCKSDATDEPEVAEHWINSSKNLEQSPESGFVSTSSVNDVRAYGTTLRELAESIVPNNNSTKLEHLVENYNDPELSTTAGVKTKPSSGLPEQIQHAQAIGEEKDAVLGSPDTTSVSTPPANTTITTTTTTTNGNDSPEDTEDTTGDETKKPAGPGAGRTDKQRAGWQHRKKNMDISPDHYNYGGGSTTKYNPKHTNPLKGNKKASLDEIFGFEKFAIDVKDGMGETIQTDNTAKGIKTLDDLKKNLTAKKKSVGDKQKLDIQNDKWRNVKKQEVSTQPQDTVQTSGGSKDIHITVSNIVKKATVQNKDKPINITISLNGKGEVDSSDQQDTNAISAGSGGAVDPVKTTLNQKKGVGTPKLKLNPNVGIQAQSNIQRSASMNEEFYGHVDEFGNYVVDGFYKNAQAEGNPAQPAGWAQGNPVDPNTYPNGNAELIAIEAQKRADTAAWEDSQNRSPMDNNNPAQPAGWAIPQGYTQRPIPGQGADAIQATASVTPEAYTDALYRIAAVYPEVHEAAFMLAADDEEDKEPDNDADDEKTEKSEEKSEKKEEKSEKKVAAQVHVASTQPSVEGGIVVLANETSEIMGQVIQEDNDSFAVQWDDGYQSLEPTENYELVIHEMSPENV